MKKKSFLFYLKFIFWFSFSLIVIISLVNYYVDPGNIYSSSKKHYNKKPKVLVKGKNFINQSRNFFIKSDVYVLPLIDDNNKLVDLIFRDDIFIDRKKKHPKINVPVVIMAGGKGTRLKPFSDILPKALVPLNGKTILEVN